MPKLSHELEGYSFFLQGGGREGGKSETVLVRAEPKFLFSVVFFLTLSINKWEKKLPLKIVKGDRRLWKNFHELGAC